MPRLYYRTNSEILCVCVDIKVYRTLKIDSKYIAYLQPQIEIKQKVFVISELKSKKKQRTDHST